MENKWKKVGTILLTIYLTLVTIGCGLFGYLYFSSKAQPGTSLDAKSLVNTVCYDLGFISKEEYVRRGGKVDATASNSSEVSAQTTNTSKFEIAYDKTDMDLSEIESYYAEVEFTFKTQLLIFRELVYSDGYKEDVSYNTQYFISAEQFNALDCELSFSYKVVDNSVILQFANSEKAQSSTEWNSISSGFIIVTEEKDGSWTLKITAFQSPEGTKLNNSSTVQTFDGTNIGVYTFKGKDHSLYYYESAMVQLYNPLQASEQITSATQVSMVEIKAINTQTHKKFIATNHNNTILPKSAYLPEGTYTENEYYKFFNPNMTDDDILEQANIIRNEYLSSVKFDKKVFDETAISTNIGQTAVDLALWG